MLLNTYEAAATLLAGVDAFRNERLNVSSKPRVVTGIAVVGSTAINDTSGNFYIEDHLVGTFRNTRAGVVQVIEDQDVIPLGKLFVPAGAKLSFVMNADVVGNPLIVRVTGG